MKVIDLRDLILDQEQDGDNKDSKFEYFLCSKKGNLICEPFKDETENNGLGVILDEEFGFFDQGESDEDHDSADSNREDAE